MVSSITLILISFGAGLALEWWVLRWAKRRELLAQVNERSSHQVPTPTMGGIVIVLVVVAYLLWVYPQLAMAGCG